MAYIVQDIPLSSLKSSLSECSGGGAKRDRATGATSFAGFAGLAAGAGAEEKPGSRGNAPQSASASVLPAAGLRARAGTGSSSDQSESIQSQ